MREFGKTGMNIKRVGFGGIPIQRISQEDTNKVIDELERCGVNFIDTARGYTISEEYLGNALKGRREKFYIATKSMSRDYESMKRDIEISLKNLQTDYIDLYQMHNVKPVEYDTLFGEDRAYRALLEAKEAGKIKHIGITSHGLETVERAVESGKFETIQFPYNIVENQADEVFKKAHQKGIGTIVMKPLAGGAIDDGTLAMKYLLSREYIDVPPYDRGHRHCAGHRHQRGPGRQGRACAVRQLYAADGRDAGALRRGPGRAAVFCVRRQLRGPELRRHGHPVGAGVFLCRILQRHDEPALKGALRRERPPQAGGHVQGVRQGPGRRHAQGPAH